MARRSRLILPPKPLAPARPDGRPLYFDIGSVEWVQCHPCALMGLEGRHRRGDAYMNDPANSPVRTLDGFSDGGCYIVCKAHTPENAVIYDPISGECHNKWGTEVWREDTLMPGPNGT